jgi:hypothetical protein
VVQAGQDTAAPNFGRTPAAISATRPHPKA